MRVIGWCLRRWNSPTRLSGAIEPKTKRPDQDKLADALSRLALEDPSFQVSTDSETGQTLIAGMGELHLEIIVDRLLREFKVSANVGKPQVAYRETITARCRCGRFIHSPRRRKESVWALHFASRAERAGAASVSMRVIVETRSQQSLSKQSGLVPKMVFNPGACRVPDGRCQGALDFR